MQAKRISGEELWKGAREMQRRRLLVISPCTVYHTRCSLYRCSNFMCQRTHIQAVYAKYILRIHELSQTWITRFVWFKKLFPRSTVRRCLECPSPPPPPVSPCRLFFIPDRLILYVRTRLPRNAEWRSWSILTTLWHEVLLVVQHSWYKLLEHSRHWYDRGTCWNCIQQQKHTWMTLKLLRST